MNFYIFFLIFIGNILKMKMLDFSNYSTKSKYYDDSSKLVIGKMEEETRGVLVQEFVGLKPYSFLIDNKSEH